MKEALPVMKNQIALNSLYYITNVLSYRKGGNVQRQMLAGLVTRATLKNHEGKLIFWDLVIIVSIILNWISHGSTWWAPGSVGWWTRIFFAIGASFFLRLDLGS
jgi:hypothetical protein